VRLCSQDNFIFSYNKTHLLPSFSYRLAFATQNNVFMQIFIKIQSSTGPTQYFGAFELLAQLVESSFAATIFITPFPYFCLCPINQREYRTFPHPRAPFLSILERTPTIIRFLRLFCSTTPPHLLTIYFALEIGSILICSTLVLPN
jgi:hypothetical protein